jgi:tetratricopeptide (TPR) repeat protein
VVDLLRFVGGLGKTVASVAGKVGNTPGRVGEKWRDVLRPPPFASEAWHTLGVAALEAGDVERAIHAFTRSIDLAPMEIDRAILAGQILGDAGCRVAAEEIFRRLLHLPAARAEVRADARLRLVRVLLDGGKKAEAIEELGRALAADPSNVELHHLVAAAHERVGNLVGVAEHNAAIKGNLKSFHLFDVIEFLRSQNKTGSLVTSSHHGVAIVRLVSGQIIGASAPRVRNVSVTPVDGDAQRVMALGQIQAAFAEILSWSEGDFSFHPTTAEQSDSDITFDPRAIMLDVMRAQDERARAYQPASV